MVGGGLQSPETESGGSDGGFSPLKPTSTDPTGALTKFGEIRISRQVFGQNTLDFYEIWVGFGEMSPNLGRSQPDLVAISPDLARSPPALAHFGLKSTILAGFFTVDGCNRTDRVSSEKPTAPIRLSRRSAMGQNVLHPSPASRFRVGHKPDPDRPVDTPNRNLFEASSEPLKL